MKRISLAIFTAVVVGLLAAPAFAQEEPTSAEDVEVLPSGLERDKVGEGAVLPSVQERSAQERSATAPGFLPVTGADIALFLGVALGLIVVGSIIMRLARSGADSREPRAP